MARLRWQSIRKHEANTPAQLRTIPGDQTFQPNTPQDIVGVLFHAAYMCSTHRSQANGENERAQITKYVVRRARIVGFHESQLPVEQGLEGYQTLLFKIRILLMITR
jgi:hypothetical protein